MAYFTSPEALGGKVATALLPYLPEGLHPPHNLPPRVLGFVGREHDIETLLTTLRSGQSVAVSAVVTGMAGVGKSALATEAVYRLAADPDAFPGGITWMRCDDRIGSDGLAWVYDQVLAAWDIALSPDEIGRAAMPEAVDLRERSLRFRLRPRLADTAAMPTPALVLLDNVERDLPLGRLLDTLTPLGITVLVTTRYEPASQHLRLLKLDALERAAAIQLFAERYVGRGGTWDETRDAEAIMAVVEALGCLPLAIELAAARAARQGMGVAALAAELHQPDVLTRLRDPQDPTASMQYAFEQSLALLSPTQRVRFAALGLPDGPDWPRSMIEQLLVAVPPDAGNMPDARSAGDDLDLFAALSLVTLFTGTPIVQTGNGAAQTAGAENRVRLHPLLRELARAEWARQPLAIQHAGMTALLAGVGDLVEAHEHDFATLAREEELIAGALRQVAQEHIELWQFRLTVRALNDYIVIGGHWRLGMELRTLLLAAQRRMGDRQGEASTLHNLGSLARRMGRPEEARHYFEQALAIEREVGDRRGEGYTLSGLGTVAHEIGRLEEARSYYEQALAIWREIGDRQGEAETLNNLGTLVQDQGQLDEAQAYLEQALAFRREVRDRLGEGATLNNLGTLAHSRGQLDEAQAYLEQALAIEREVGDRHGEGVALHNLGSVAEQQGRLAEAEEYYQEALTIYRGIRAEQDVQEEWEALERVRATRTAATAGTRDASGPAAPEPPTEFKPTRKKRRWWPFGR